MDTQRLKQMSEKEGLLWLAIATTTAGAALIEKNILAGLALLATGLGIIFLRGYFKQNGRYQELQE